MIFYFPQEGSAKSKDSQSMDASHYHHSVLLLDTIIQTTTATTIAATSIRENDSEWWFYRHLVVTTTQAVAATWCGFLLHQFLCFVHMWIVAFPLLLALGKVVFSRKLAHWLAVLVGGWMQWQWTGWIHYCWMMEWNLLAQDNRLYIMVWLTSTNITCFCLFALDKILALTHVAYRIPEVILHAWTWMGGVVGQMLAIQWLRHKSNTERHPTFVLARLGAALVWMAYLGYDAFLADTSAEHHDVSFNMLPQQVYEQSTKFYHQYLASSSASSSSEL